MSAADGLIFGTAGVPRSSPHPSSLAGIKEIARLGLDCMEIEFVKGVKMGLDLARQIRSLSRELNVRLSVHAPYYINFNSPEPGKRLSSQERLLTSARLAAECGAENLVFHPGFYGRDTEEAAFNKIRAGVDEVVSILRSERNPVVLRPETMGKRAQFGSLEETLLLCRRVKGLLPCVDFSHIHARSGRLNTYAEFQRILRKLEKKLGRPSLSNMHIHISGAQYNDKGEMKHLNLNESDFRFDEWIQALRDSGVAGNVICESPDQAKDALMLKNLYRS